MRYRNYILMLIICVITFLLVIYLCALYKNSSSNFNNSDIDDVLISVTGKNYEDLYNNIVNFSNENHDFIIYVASYKNNKIYDFESVFEKVISDHSFNHGILYVNVDNLKKIDYINKLFNDFSYNYFLKISDLPVFVEFHDDKITNVISIFDYDFDSLSGFLEGIYD